MRVEHVLAAATLALFGALAVSGLGRQTTEGQESSFPDAPSRLVESRTELFEFGGPLLDEPTHAVVFVVSNGRLARLDVDRGSLVQSDIRAVIDDAVHPAVVPREGGLAVQGLDPEAGRSTLVVGTDLGAAPVVLGSSGYFVSSPAQDRVWLAIPAAGVVGPDGALRAIREMTVDGEITLPDAAPPERSALLGVLPEGHVFRTPGGRVEVRDPARADPVLSVAADSVLGVGSGRLAWCTAGCLAVSVFEPGAARAWSIVRPADVVAFGETGAFSPDGRYVAVPVGVRGAQGLHGAMLMVAVDRQAAWVIPDSDGVPLDAPVAWSPAGEWVFFGRSGNVLGAYRLGTTGVRRVPVDVGAVTALAVI
jgi:hypothetical protein